MHHALQVLTVGRGPTETFPLPSVLALLFETPLHALLGEEPGQMDVFFVDRRLRTGEGRLDSSCGEWLLRSCLNCGTLGALWLQSERQQPTLPRESLSRGAGFFGCHS